MKPPSTRRDREAVRAAGVVVLLLASLVLTMALAWQAVDAARSHRAASTAVLQDFAAMAGRQFIWRTSAAVGSDAFQIVTVLRQMTDAAPPGALPERTSIGQALGPRAAQMLTLAGTFFRYEPDFRHLTCSDPLPEPLAEALLGSLAEAPGPTDDPDLPFVVHPMVVDGEAHVFVTASLAPECRQPATVVGFELNSEGLSPRMEEILKGAPLLPPAMGGGKVGNEHFSLVVRDAAGRERFRAGAFPASGFAAEAAFGKAYQGVLEGMTVNISLDEAAAPRLVIGGLPSSRLPSLLLLLALSVGFVAAGIQQLRRERAVAALRSEFVSRVSHEMRTPLTQIRMFTETLLLDRTRTEEERLRALEIIDREARRLGHLVENALRFTRGERRTLTLDPRICDLGPLLRDALESFEPLVLRAGTRIESRLSGVLMARVDQDALRQILLNLLDNAAKYGPEGQTILVGAETLDGAVRLWVEDQGPGIPVGERERIWRPFQRLHRDETAAIAGTGIGLSVVRDLTLLHEGRCWVESGARGGARFVVEFASRPAAAGPDTDEADGRDVVGAGV